VSRHAAAGADGNMLMERRVRVRRREAGSAAPMLS